MLVLLLLLLSVGALAQPQETQPPAWEAETTAGESFTHLPVAELITATTCVYCPDAEAKLDDIFHNDGYPWYYVALVSNENDEANRRAAELEGPTWGTPTTEFDGGDETVSGGGADRSEYTQAIEDTGERDDTPVALNLSMEPVAGDANRALFTFTARWEEEGTGLNPDLQVHIYLYVMERVSTRYQNEHSHEWVHHGFLAFAFDEDVDLQPNTNFTRTVEWIGADNSDEHGNMSTVEYGNLLAMIAVLNNEATQTDNYALEGAGAIPPLLTVNAPADNSTVSGEVHLNATGVANHTLMESLQYRVDQGQWADLVATSGDYYEGLWDSAEVENGAHQLEFRATDATGTRSLANLTVHTANDKEPPTLEWLSPTLSQPLSEVVTLTVTATDPIGIASVAVQVEEGPLQDMELVDQDTYAWDLDTTLYTDDLHTLKVQAEDNSHNLATLTYEFTVNNQVAPLVEWHSPDPSQPLSRVVSLSVTVTDSQGVESVKLKVDQGPYQALAAAGEDLYTLDWNTATVADGNHTLTVRAEDSGHNVATLQVEVSVDNGGGPTLPEVLLEAPQPASGPLQGRVQLTVYASDPEGVDSVEYSFDGGRRFYSLTQGEGDLWSAAWDTARALNGQVTLWVRATDGIGTSNSLNATFTIDNEPPLLTASLSHLVAGEVWATQTLTVEARDTQGLVEVSYRVDGQEWLPLTPQSGDLFQAEWDTSSLDSGYHDLEVKAVDEVGNEALWTTSCEVVNMELAYAFLDKATPPAQAPVELYILAVYPLEQVRLIILSPPGLEPVTAQLLPAGNYLATLPEFAAETTVTYQVVLTTDHGEVVLPSQTFTVAEAQGVAEPDPAGTSLPWAGTPLLAVGLALALMAVNLRRQRVR